MRNMRKQLYATLACFLLTSVTTYGQGWKLYEEAAKGESYAKFDCVALLDSTSVSVQPTGQGSFAVCKVIKVQTPKGAVANRVIKYDYDPLTAHAEFKRVTIYHADGQIEEVDVKKTCDYAAPARAIYWGARQIMIEVGALNPGDVIDYEIAKKSSTAKLQTRQRSPAGLRRRRKRTHAIRRAYASYGFSWPQCESGNEMLHQWQE